MIRRHNKSKQETLAALQGPDTADCFLQLERGQKKFTIRGALALGIRRNMSHVSTSTVGHVLLQDIHWGTVARAELKCGAAIIGSAKLFQQQADAQACHALGFNLIVHSSRGDATNTAIWRKNKLHVYELESAIPDQESLEDDYPAFMVSRVFADLQCLAKSNAATTLAVIEKQMACVGAPSWRNPTTQAVPDDRGHFLERIRLSLYTSDLAKPVRRASVLVTRVVSRPGFRIRCCIVRSSPCFKRFPKIVLIARAFEQFSEQ